MSIRALLSIPDNGYAAKNKQVLARKWQAVEKTRNKGTILAMNNEKRNTDSWYMMRALEQAKQAFALDEVPIGALVVDEHGVILGAGFNTTEHDCSQASHAELKALQRAGQQKKDWRLDGATLFVTLEPCVMCVGAARLSRIGRIVFGAESPLFGFRLDNDLGLWLYNKDAMVIQGGVEHKACSLILKEFFQQKRKKGEWKKNGKGYGEDKSGPS